MSKLTLALKLLKSPYAKKIARSPRARRVVVKALKNDKVRNAVIKQVSKRMFSR